MPDQEPLTDAELERLEGQDWGHRNHRGLCIGCTRHFGGLHEWPCDIARLLAEVRRLRAELGILQSAMKMTLNVADPDWIACCDHCGCRPDDRNGHDDTCAMGCNDEPQ